MEEDVTGKGHIRYNGQFAVSRISLDIVATKDDEVHGFLIKSGEEINPENEKTRRELLEIYVHYELNKLFMINMNTLKLIDIDFALNPKVDIIPDEEQIKTWHWVLMGIAFGYIIAKAISF